MKKMETASLELELERKWERVWGRGSCFAAAAGGGGGEEEEDSDAAVAAILLVLC
jgi:hypothetical protein